MKITLAKNVTDGCLVSRRGNKYIICKYNRKPSGLYRRAHQEETKMYTMDGKIISIIKDFPEGIAFWGPAIVNTTKKLEVPQ